MMNWGERLPPIQDFKLPSGSFIGLGFLQLPPGSTGVASADGLAFPFVVEALTVHTIPELFEGIGLLGVTVDGAPALAPYFPLVANRSIGVTLENQTRQPLTVTAAVRGIWTDAAAQRKLDELKQAAFDDARAAVSPLWEPQRTESGRADPGPICPECGTSPCIGHPRG